MDSEGETVINTAFSAGDAPYIRDQAGGANPSTIHFPKGGDMTVKQYTDMAHPKPLIYKMKNGARYMLIQKIMTPGPNIFCKLAQKYPGVNVSIDMSDLERVE